MVINKNSILYFSGTGNTYDVSKKVANKCEFELINISTLREEKIIEINCDVIGIACPIYYGGIPKVVRNVVDKIQKIDNKYIFILATYGGMPGNPIKIIDNSLNSKGMKISSGFLFKMPGNYIALYDARNKKVQIKNFEKANKKIDEIANIINYRKVVSYEKSPYIIDRPFSVFSTKRVEGLSSYDKKFIVDNKCNKCGLCMKICPVNNIKLKDRVITWDGRCEQCMSCIQYCPKEAIQVGSKTINRKRYRNPNVDYFKVLVQK